ncbi:SH3 domain-containing protein [Stigmatella aurantiaca]|uniref:SH3b domain-containing protein n=2 Tax=Stigmatella aurantiaca (strain DW4/3-1) TaxID=378806 RepID=E3FN15_STIAD|nr:SH3 domain-containing protein [Stigmatella aurantiaca]ADO73130.1 uncharacterized protein STAUR_5359 [Stigmatella aurantiaca DW4/3-1]
MTSGHSMKVLAILAALAAGCGSGPSAVESVELKGADEGVGTRDSALTSCVTAGANLQTTTDLNLRSGPATSYGILLTMPGSAIAKEAGGGCPTSGWYKVTYSGITGWASGTYLNLATSTPPSTTRDSAIVRAQSAMGFSYWWGHGGWKEGAAKGSCSGNCPSCTHSGSYGADCSGFLAKAWVVPSSNSNMATDSHPYSTISFNSDTSQWTTISRDNLLKADALVYNTDGAGHTFLYESGDGWGSMWAYECKGCAYGCVHNLRTATTTYHAIRHY